MKRETACFDCGLVIRLPQGDAGGECRCARCHCLIARSGKSFGIILPILLSAIIFFALSLCVPLFEIEVGGFASEITLLQTIILFFKDGYVLVGTVALLGGIVIPPLMMGLLLIVLIFSKKARPSPLMRFCFRFYQRLRALGMAEVYLVSLLITIVKLNEMSKLVYQEGLILFAAYLIGFYIVSVWFNPQDVWNQDDVSNR